MTHEIKILDAYADADILLSAIKKERDRIADTYGKNDEYVRCLEKYAMNIVSEAPTIIPAESEGT